MAVIDITDNQGKLLEPEWLAKAESVHRQLRPHLPVDYVGTMKRIFAGGGRMAVAVEQQQVHGVAVWRCYENTVNGLFLYVDDLITDESLRSRGVGKQLLEHCREIARHLGCNVFSLDSGTHRTQAHKFYFREQMHISAFHFIEELK